MSRLSIKQISRDNLSSLYISRDTMSNIYYISRDTLSSLYISRDTMSSVYNIHLETPCPVYIYLGTPCPVYIYILDRVFLSTIYIHYINISRDTLSKFYFLLFSPVEFISLKYSLHKT